MRLKRLKVTTLKVNNNHMLTFAQVALYRYGQSKFIQQNNDRGSVIGGGIIHYVNLILPKSAWAKRKIRLIRALTPIQIRLF